jgi:hypothetical protein
LKELFFGMDTIKLGGESKNVDAKPKLYNAMDLDEPETGKKVDKGKGKEVTSAAELPSTA